VREITFSIVLIIGAGGFLGTVTRYLMVQFVDSKFSSEYPLGTLAVNITGCFVIGLIYGLSTSETVSDNNWKLFLTTGFCGGFTTFSAFALENTKFLEQKMIAPALVYITASVVLSIVAAILGTLSGKLIHG
jgi:fluoride exporter